MFSKKIIFVNSWLIFDFLSFWPFLGTSKKIFKKFKNQILIFLVFSVRSCPFLKNKKLEKITYKLCGVFQKYKT